MRLSDGRRLAYAEYGAEDGIPVFLFHGLPGSRLCWGRLPDDPFPEGVRVLAPDRPGYGLSDPKLGRTLLDWADDVACLADKLKLNAFSVIGVSGGGPGALACSWKMPERVASAGVVAGAAPTNAPGVFEGISANNRFFLRLAWRWPWASRTNARVLACLIRRSPDWYIRTMQGKVHETDREILARPEIRALLAQDFAEALRSGGQGMVDDLSANHGAPWGFALGEISARVQFWYGELDRSAPPAMGYYLSDQVRGSTFTLVPNTGHLWIFLHLREVINAVVSAVQR